MIMAKSTSRKATTSTGESFALANHHLAQGFVAVPRWLIKTPLWTRLNAAHRAVILTLLLITTRQDRIWEEAGIPLRRGQCLVGMASLAKLSGASQPQARRAIDNAVEAGLLSREHQTFTAAGQTHRVSLFTWPDFDLIDLAGKKTGKRTGKSAGTSDGRSSGNSITNSSTRNRRTRNTHSRGQKDCPYGEIDDAGQ
jgi:hypothetical protein